VFNPWHDIALGSEFPHEFDIFVEIPYKSRIKYELDKETGLVRVDRILYSAVYYPANYGLIPRTYCEDKDPLDVFILGEDPLAPGVIATVRPIGIVRMVDGGEMDDKIVAVLAKDPLFNAYRHVEDVPPHMIRKIQRFLEDYKILENKKVLVKGIEGNAEAKRTILEARELYDKTFKSPKPGRKKTSTS
jgi:inorganic pyrophosphatase